MKKSILSNTILLTGSLLLLTVESGCVFSKQKGQDTKKQEATNFLNELKDLSNKLKIFPKLSPCNSSEATTSNTGPSSNKWQNFLKSSPFNSSEATTSNTAPNLNQKPHKTNQVCTLDPLTIKFYTDVQQNNKALTKLSNIVYVAKPKAYKWLNFLKEKVLPKIKDSKKREIFSIGANLLKQGIDTIEDIKKVLQDKKKEIETTQQLAKEIYKFLKLYEKCEDQKHLLLGSMNGHEKESKLAPKAKEVLDSLECLHKEIQGNNNVNDLKQVISKLKEAYNIYLALYGKVITVVSDFFKKEKILDVKSISLLIQVYFTVLGVIYIHDYGSMVLEEAIQKLNQHPNNIQSITG